MTENNTSRLEIRLDNRTKALGNKAAKKSGITLSALVRKLLKEHVNGQRSAKAG